MAGFNVISIDFAHEYTTGKKEKLATDLNIDITDYTPEQLYFGVFIKTSKMLIRLEMMVTAVTL